MVQVNLKYWFFCVLEEQIFLKGEFNKWKLEKLLTIYFQVIKKI